MAERDSDCLTMNQKDGGCSEFTLKMVALVFMVIDHVHSYLDVGSAWISLLPRFVAPLFVYFLVEGFYHTHSWKKYFLRVFSFAMIMLGGNVTINCVFLSVNDMIEEIDFYSLMEGNNIFLTLAVYLLLLKFVQKIQESWRAKADQNAKLSQKAGKNRKAQAGREMRTSCDVKRYGYLILVIGLSVLSIPFCEGSIYLLPLLFVFYFCRGKKSWICAGVAIWSALLFVKALASYYSGGTGISLYATLCFSNEWAMIAVLIPIFLYSGRRGNDSKIAKWLFYIIYPVHLWILMIWSNSIDWVAIA